MQKRNGLTPFRFFYCHRLPTDKEGVRMTNFTIPIVTSRNFKRHLKYYLRLVLLLLEIIKRLVELN
jgi:hypothetical protein